VQNILIDNVKNNPISYLIMDNFNGVEYYDLTVNVQYNLNNIQIKNSDEIEI
jgi:hypothetical protein